MRFDLFSFFRTRPEEPVEEKKSQNDMNEENEEETIPDGIYLDNYINPENEDFISSKIDKTKLEISPEINYPKFIFSRKNFILYFNM